MDKSKIKTLSNNIEYCIFVILRQMMDHYTNMFPQLIHDTKILGLVQSFMA